MSRKPPAENKPNADAFSKALARIDRARKTSATKLNFSRLGLTELPETIGQLAQLQELNLYDNKLTTLPESLSQLTQLQEINLWSNKLTTLPKSLGQLTQLRVLCLGNNELTVLPKWIGQLTQLQELHLWTNQFTVLPKSLGQLTQLRKLYLSDNKLTTLPEWLGQLTQLQELNLWSNKLKTLPESLGQLTQLQMLNLSNNRLTSLPESLLQLKSLTHLFLHGNDAMAIPAEVLGPDWLNVSPQSTEPANSNEILDYYFRTRGGQQPLNETERINVDRDVQKLLDGVDLKGTRQRERRVETREIKERPMRLFISYSHKDENLRFELQTHLKLLQRLGIIHAWDDRRIEAGDEWKEKVDENLERADIILFLISADFIASDYCYEIEMKRALERHKNGEVRVIPVIVRDCNWRIAPFAKLQALPKNGKAVKKWPDKDSAWRNVAEGIERVVEEIRRK